MESRSDVQYIVVHGYRRAFRISGSGPALLLLHGLACDSSTWRDVIPSLSEHFTVIAPDLLGHGESDKPDADYSLGGYANGMRDLLTILGIDRVTVVGHSFGGGVAMQFAYQFPDRTERVVLISTGGLGKEVTPLIRFLTVPGSSAAIAAATFGPWRSLVSGALRSLSRLPISATRDLDEVARIYEALADPGQRTAVQRVTSHVLNWRGQYVTMTDRSYLARLMPVLVIWGRQDMVIPSTHAELAPTQVSDVHILDDSGHFPHKDHPEEVCRLVMEFVASNEPAQYHRGRWRTLLRRGDQFELESVPTGDDSAPAIG
jgi:pimeloyl-ACP methyl ester carboxylesterase